MSGPFIFIATNRLKPGKLAGEKKRVPGLVDFVEANEATGANDGIFPEEVVRQILTDHSDAEYRALQNRPLRP